MATGREDYWYAMMPGRPGLGVGQSAWYSHSEATISESNTGYLLNYIIPTSYALNFEGGIISCNWPGIKRYGIYKSEILVSGAFFDQCIVLPYSSGGSHLFNAGDELKVFIYNFDSVAVTFFVSVFGYLTYKIG